MWPLAEVPVLYCPRTLFSMASGPRSGASARSTLIFSSRTASDSMLTGGSMAMMTSSCSRWFCTMSLSAPVWS